MSEKDLSARDVARLCGVSPSLVSAWLGGANPSDSLAVLRLCEATGAGFQYLLTGIPSKNPERLHEIFSAEELPELSGIFHIEIRKLKRRR